jgi:hypothetical protein
VAAGRKQVRAALGFSVHTGWAALVAVAGPVEQPVVLDRRRVEMIPGSEPEKPPYVYHAARNLALPAGDRLVREWTAIAQTRARAQLAAAVAELASHQLVAAAILVGGQSGRSGQYGMRSLETILQSHALVHAAEGEMYRDAIRVGAEAAGLAVVEVRAKEVHRQAAKAFGMTEAKVAEHLGRIGKAAGRPWDKDNKEACLAALIALSA